jgi:Ca-activated chloride channel family protein
MREFAVSDDGREFAAASEDFRTAAAAAAFGLALRDSAYKGAAGYQLVIDMLTPAQGNEASADRARLLDLAKKAKAIAG